jgi:flagellar motor switch protein FliM
MPEVLSQDEIDQLLKVINSGETEPEDFRPASDVRKIKIHDFKRSDKFTQEQMHYISIIHETFSQDLAALISGALRKTTCVDVVFVDQLTYEEFTRSVPAPATFAIFDMDPLKGGAVLEIDSAVTFAMIDRLFGGDGEIKERHKLTALEEKVMADVINACFLVPLRNAWKKILELSPVLKRIDTEPLFSRIVPPDEKVVLVMFECRIGDVEGMINLCFPFLTIAPVLNKLNALYWYSGVEKERSWPAGAASLNEALDRVNIPVTIELGRKDINIKTIKTIEKGTILELDKLATEPLNVFAGDVLIAQGEVLVIDEKFGILITELAGEKNEY